MKKSQFIRVLVFLLIILLLVGIFAYKYWGKKVTEISSIVNTQSEKLYKVNLSLNSGVSEPKPYSFDKDYGSSELGDYLVDILVSIDRVSFIFCPIVRFGESIDRRQSNHCHQTENSCGDNNLQQTESCLKFTPDF